MAGLLVMLLGCSAPSVVQGADAGGSHSQGTHRGSTLTLQPDRVVRESHPTLVVFPLRKFEDAQPRGPPWRAAQCYKS